MDKPVKVQDAIDSKLIEQRKVFLWGQVDDGCVLDLRPLWDR